jgi:hypothetical protein
MSSSEGEEEEGDGSALLRKSTGSMGETTEEQIARLRAERDAEREKLELAAKQEEREMDAHAQLAQQREWAEEDTETGAGGAGETQSPPNNTSPTKAEEAAAAEEAAQMQAQMEQMAAQLELAKQEAAELASRCDAEQSQLLESTDRRAREADAAKLLKADERVRCAHGPQRSLEPLPPQPQSRTAERIEETARPT